MRSSTSRPRPRTSMFCPPSRGSGARSSTVTSYPIRSSQYAAAGPAMLAPVTRTRVVREGSALMSPSSGSPENGGTGVGSGQESRSPSGEPVLA